MNHNEELTHITDKMKIMLDALQGKRLQSRYKDHNDAKWSDIKSDIALMMNWNWYHYDYRIVE